MPSWEKVKIIQDSSATNTNNYNFEQAQVWQDSLFLIAKRWKLQDSSFLGLAYYNQGRIFHFQGDIQKAKSNYEKAVSTFRAYEERKENLGGLLSNLGLINSGLGNYVLSIKYLKESLQIDFELVGRESEYYANGLENLGTVYYEMFEYQKAIKHFNESYAIKDALLGSNHLSTVQVKSNLGLVYSDLKQFGIAERLYMDVYENLDSENPSHHFVNYSVNNNLGEIYYQFEAYDQAEFHFSQALEFIENIIGNENMYYADVLGNLGAIYDEVGQKQKAFDNYNEALRIMDKLELSETYKYGMKVMSIGIIHYKLNQFEKALEFIEKSRAIFEKSIGIDNYHMGINYTNTSKIYEGKNRLDEALKWISKANQIYKEVYGSSHLNSFQTGIKKLQLQLKLDRKKINVEAFELYLHQAIEYFENTAKYMSDIDLQNLNSTFEDFYNTVSFICQSNVENEKLQALYLKWLWFQNGYILDRRIFLKQLETQNENLSDIIEKRNEINSQIVNQWALPIEDQTNVDSLLRIANGIEKSLVLSNQDHLKQRVNNIDEFRNGLSSDQWICQFYMFSMDTINQYGAIVFSKDEILNIPLDNLQKMDATLTSLVKNKDPETINSLYEDDSENRQLLYESLWNPILSKVPTESKIYYSLDGNLHRFNLEMLSPSNHSYEFHLFNNLRQLSQLNKESKRISSAYIFADIDYGEAKEMLWKNLPNTKKEGEKVSRILKDNSIKSKTFDGLTANELEVKEALSKTNFDVLHFATHGYFKSKIEGINNRKSVLFHKDPLNNSGLVLSNVNNTLYAVNSSNDGMLTSLELSALNLKQTNLAVLSACQSGLGEISKQEGVYGLQRALSGIGVDNIIMTLWEVSDKHTLYFMEAFYLNWIEYKMPLKNAFVEAQKEIKEQYGDPYFYAGFVLLENHMIANKLESNRLLYLGILVCLFVLSVLIWRRINKIEK